MVKDKVWSFGGFFCFCFALFSVVCNATLAPAFSFGKTHPMDTNWVKCRSAVSLMPQVFGYCNPLNQCSFVVHLFLIVECLHIPGLWLQSTSLIPPLSAGILLFPHSSEIPLTFLPAVPKIA